MPEFPVQISKVQPPPLRDETLARDRLLDWLSVKIHRRVVLLTAEAGYGKTTLLADFTRRTRLRVLWFRLDRGDRDWTSFIAHLVAAIRLHVPEFGVATRSLLAETATTAPTLETVFEAFLRELISLPVEPTAFVFDDFHIVDDAPDIRHIARELLGRGPERMSFVFASRREPPIRLARLRALGEVAELRTDDLRFDATETERLFRETYEMQLEPSVLAELGRRTEGWAASLQLVRAALHERNPGQVRSFISSLSGAEGHLYEYLAEEVIGELPDDLQQFLMRTSVLETVDAALGPVAAEVSAAEAMRHIENAERQGLLGKTGRGRYVARAHPLVREFLQSRLLNSIGPEGLERTHLRIARAAEQHNWRVAAQEYLAAGFVVDAERVLTAAIQQIIGSGATAIAGELAAAIPGGVRGAAGLVLRSRIALQRASSEEGLRLAEDAFRVDPQSSIGLLNLVAARGLAGDIAGALDAGRALDKTDQIQIAALGRAYLRILEASLHGSVKDARRQIDEVAGALRGTPETHFLGVALLNRAYVDIALGEPVGALESATEAIAILDPISYGVDAVAARVGRAAALAYLSRMDEAREELRLGGNAAEPGQRLEFAAEVAVIEGHLGEAGAAWPFIDRVAPDVDPMTDSGEQALLGKALLLVADGEFEVAAQTAARFVFGRPSSFVAMEAQRHLIVGLTSALVGDSDAALKSIRTGRAIAQRQDARLWADYGQLLEALVDSKLDPSREIERARQASPGVISMLAELVIRLGGTLSIRAIEVLLDEAGRRPWKWRAIARRHLRSGAPAVRDLSARVLELVGEAEDVSLLREASKSGGGGGTSSRYATLLARRLADRVFVEDLGRVRIHIGSRTLDGSGVRRRVLALLCLLLSRPDFVSTREEVIDNLWPDHDPDSALNSLNQTAYFLRRVFEPNYRDDLSPGYLGQDAETIWLDPELIDCRSRRCLEITRSMPSSPSPEGSVALASEYRGRYALDFAYEEWATPYRDQLHAAYLKVMEQAIRLDANAGQVARGTFLAERAAEVDPDSEEIQTALIRLYRMSGAHAAAAEKYGQYERLMRELGVDAVPLDEI